MQPVVIFSHGKESGPKATKIVAMQEIVSELGLKSYSLDYQGMDEVESRVSKLQQFMSTIDRPFILIGSSMGAYVSMSAASEDSRVVGMFLLAPAVGFAGYETEKLNIKAQTMSIIHGWNDEVVSVEKVYDFAKKHQINLELVKDDHRLGSSISYIKDSLKRFLSE